MFEDLGALSEFPEESTTEVVLIAGKLHTEWKGTRQYGGREMTTTKRVDNLAKAQHLWRITQKFRIGCYIVVQWSDGAKLAKCDRVVR